jgi:hypothetical protein
LLSGRSQQRLMELHRAAGTALQALSQHHSLLVGALRGCDMSTQQSMLEEHRMLVASALETLARLGTFIEQCKIVPAAESAERNELLTLKT